MGDQRRVHGCMVLHGIAWYCMVLHHLAPSCTMLHHCAQHYPRVCQSMPESCQSHSKVMPKSCQSHAKVIPKSCQSHAKVMPKSCQCSTHEASISSPVIAFI